MLLACGFKSHHPHHFCILMDQEPVTEHKLYFTYNYCDEHGAYIGVITQGHLQFGDEKIRILDVEKAKTKREIIAWGEYAMAERPWVLRS